MNLYDIDYALRMLEDYNVDVDTGEILSEEEFFTKWDEIKMALNDKIEQTILFSKNIDAEIDAIKAEEDRLKARRKAKENLSQRLKDRIDAYIKFQFTDEEGNVNTDELNKYVMETSRMRLSYRKSDKVVVTDINTIPEQYVKTTIESKPILNDIKKALKNGETVGDAVITTNYNMQIK